MKGTPMRNHPSALSLARVALPLAGLLLAALAGCGGPSTPAPSTGPQAAPSVHQPIATSAADWKPVTDILGRTGSFGDHNTVYRIPLTRSDLHIVSGGVAIKPGLSLGGYAAMAKYDDGTMMMGDLVVTEAELPKVTDALQAHGIYQTALHKHLLEQSPPVWWTHVHAMGDPTKIAQGLRAALDATAIPAPTPRPANQPPLALDTTGINQALGRTGTADGGIYKFTIARADSITDDGHLVPSSAPGGLRTFEGPPASLGIAHVVRERLGWLVRQCPPDEGDVLEHGVGIDGAVEDGLSQSLIVTGSPHVPSWRRQRPSTALRGRVASAASARRASGSISRRSAI
jgi:hypothetical protein